MIEAKNITKSFENKTILDNISAVMNNGKCNLIIGKSGAGKTVFMKCLTGIFKPDEGDVIYDGVSLLGMKKKDIINLRRQTGVLFQGSALFDSMTVFENVMFPMEMFSKKSHKEQCEKAMSLLEIVGLSEAKNKYPTEISGGMMKRAAIARAIALEPKYLFCDEPNSGLDPTNSHKIDQLIKNITTEFNMTTIINTHDMNTVKSIGDQVFFIDSGTIEWRGVGKEIVESDNTKVIKFINTIEED